MIDEAVKELEKANDIEKEDPIIKDHLGDAYFEKGLFNKARVQWEKSLELKADQEKVKQKIKAVKTNKKMQEKE